MKLKDLKAGMWVELRNGLKYLILTNADTLYDGENITVGIREGGYRLFTNERYNDDLTNKDFYNSDVVKIYYNHSLNVNGSTYEFNNIPLYWEREERTELTIAEIEDKLKLPNGSLRIKDK